MAFNAYTGYIYSTVGITLKIMYDCINEWMYMNQVHTIQLGIVTHGPFTIYFIMLFSTTETVGFGQHQWSDTFLYAGDKCTGYSAGSSVCRSISKPTWYVITLVWLLLFCLYHQGYWYAKMVVCQTITILSHITCTLLLWFSLIILISTFRFLNTNIS